MKGADMLKTSLKLLVLGDTPLGHTGFARVLNNLLKRWAITPTNPNGTFESVDYWAIGYPGVPHKLPYALWPAGGADWATAGKLNGFLHLVATRDFSHVFILQDHFHFDKEFTDVLAETCRARGIKLIYYVPVDAPLDSRWMSLPNAADVCVAYTEYGKREMHKAGVKRNVAVIPHGVEFDTYHPANDAGRDDVRAEIFGQWGVTADDTVMLNVSMNQRRKGLANTFQVQRYMMDFGLPTRLVMHMTPENHQEQTSMTMVSQQLGLRPDVHWRHTGKHWKSDAARLSEAQLNRLYNACDILISTSLGEGWGLPIVEAAASGMPLIAVPDNTACREIYDQFTKLGDGTGSKFVLLPSSTSGFVQPHDNSRIRYPIDPKKSAEEIIRSWQFTKTRVAPNAAIREWLNWDRIAGEFLKLMLQ